MLSCSEVRSLREVKVPASSTGTRCAPSVVVECEFHPESGTWKLRQIRTDKCKANSICKCLFLVYTDEFPFASASSFPFNSGSVMHDWTAVSGWNTVEALAERLELKTLLEAVAQQRIAASSHPDDEVARMSPTSDNTRRTSRWVGKKKVVTSLMKAFVCTRVCWGIYRSRRSL